jgi:hypothetical protein
MIISDDDEIRETSPVSGRDDRHDDVNVSRAPPMHKHHRALRRTLRFSRLAGPTPLADCYGLADAPGGHSPLRRFLSGRMR